MLYNEDQLKRIALALESLSYKGNDQVYRLHKQSLYDVPLLEYGDFGGNCRQLGVYSYRGFDVCVTDVHGDTPEEGKEYTVGIYNIGEQDAVDMYVGEKFSFTTVVKEINACIDDLDKTRGVILASVNECTCGAKYTSNPNFHLASVCNIK